MRRVRLGYVGAVAAALALALACSSGGSSGGGGGGGGGGGNNCPDVSGTWALSGTCDSSCNIAQNGCSVTLSCSPSGSVYQGSVNGSSISFGDGSGTCTGSIANKTGSGSCSDPSLGSCQWSATCQSGGCLSSTGSGGSTGTGGSSGIDCNSSCNSITACCSQMSMSSCMDGCTSQPNTSAACLNCFNDTSCGSFVPCIVANCGVPGSLCPASAG